jgi:hypothetical protein
MILQIFINTFIYDVEVVVHVHGLEEIDDQENVNTQRKTFNKQAIPKLIQADEMHLVGKTTMTLEIWI